MERDIDSQSINVTITARCVFPAHVQSKKDEKSLNFR